MRLWFWFFPHFILGFSITEVQKKQAMLNACKTHPSGKPKGESKACQHFLTAQCFLISVDSSTHGPSGHYLPPPCPWSLSTAMHVATWQSSFASGWAVKRAALARVCQRGAQWSEEGSRAFCEPALGLSLLQPKIKRSQLAHVAQFLSSVPGSCVVPETRSVFT